MTVRCLHVISSRDSSEGTCGPADDNITSSIITEPMPTVMSSPGQIDLSTAYWSITALLQPFSGIWKACYLIGGQLRPKTHHDKRFLPVQVVEDIIWLNPKNRNIHDRIILPLGFTFRKIQEEIEFRRFEGDSEKISCTTISCTHGRLKSVVAICQIFFSCIRLCHARRSALRIRSIRFDSHTIRHNVVRELGCKLARNIHHCTWTSAHDGPCGSARGYLLYVSRVTHHRQIYSLKADFQS